MKKIARLALLFSGLLIFTTAIAVFASGMPIDTVKTTPLEPQIIGMPADNDASNDGTNTVSQNPVQSTDTTNTPSTNNDNVDSWMDGWSWSVCPDEFNA